MSGTRARWLALLLAAGFAWGILRLFGVQFSIGDVYPEYSSLRSDPIGSRLLFESLARLPGLTVTRNYLPLEYFPEKAATVLLLGLGPATLEKAEFLQSIEKLAGLGNRAVIALAPSSSVEPSGHSGALERLWGVRIGGDSKKLSFVQAKGWKVLDGAIERGFGKGAVVLFAESDLFANASAIEFKGLAPVTAALGAHGAIVFDEAHFGITESGSVVGLARRYHLLGMVLGLAICAALALWRNASAFPPRGESREPERLSGRTSFAGLVTLLRRHIRAEELTSVCWQEWLKSNRRQISPERTQRAEALASGAAGRPLEAVREIQAVVRAKGEL